MAVYQNLKNKANNKVKNMVGGQIKKMMAGLLANLLLIFMCYILPIVLLVGLFGGLVYAFEMITHQDAVEAGHKAIQEVTGGEDLIQTVKIIQEGNNYKYQFSEEFLVTYDKKLKESNTQYRDLGLKDFNLLQTFIEAELSTELPDLNGSKVASINTTIGSTNEKEESNTPKVDVKVEGEANEMQLKIAEIAADSDSYGIPSAGRLLLSLGQ